MIVFIISVDRLLSDGCRKVSSLTWIVIWGWRNRKLFFISLGRATPFLYLILCFLLFVNPSPSFCLEVLPDHSYLLSRYFPWSDDLLNVNYSRAEETFVYASASWPWYQQALNCDTFFLYYEEDLYPQLSELVPILKQRLKKVYIVLDPSPYDEEITFVDLYYNEDQRNLLTKNICDLVSNLSYLEVDGFVVGDEWPRGLNEEEIRIDSLVNHNETYHIETGFWMHNELEREEQSRLANWFYERSLDAWNIISNVIDARFPDITLGTNIDLILRLDLSSSEVPFWASVDLWDMIDLEPYDFIVTHYFTKQSQYSYGEDPVWENCTNISSIKDLRGALENLQGSTHIGSRRIYLMLAAHCSYPHIITPAQMVDEWNTAAVYELGGLGWFTFDLWPSGNITGDWWIDSTSIAESRDVPMRYDRLLTLTGILDAHNHISSLAEVDKSRTQNIWVMEAKIQEDLRYLSSQDYERLKRYPVEIDHANETIGITKTHNITHDPNLQVNPKISGRRIVWEDGRNGNRDIYVYNLDNNEEIRITMGGDQEHPDIKGKYVAYWDLFFAPRYIWVQDFITRIWNLTNITWVEYRRKNESHVYIKGLGHNIGTSVYINPGNGSKHSFYLTVSYTGEWNLTPILPVGKGYSALVNVSIMPTGMTWINLNPGDIGNPQDSFPFRLTFNPDYIRWISLLGQDSINRSSEAYWKSSRGLCVYDLTTNTVRVLDLVPMMGTKTVFIDDVDGWVGYQTERNTLTFYSILDDRKIIITKWGASTNLQKVSQGQAIWTQTTQHYTKTYHIDLESQDVSISQQPYKPDSNFGQKVFEENKDIMITYINETPLTIGLTLLTLWLILDRAFNLDIIGKSPGNHRQTVDRRDQF